MICSQRLTLCGWNLSFSFNVRDTNWEAGKGDRYYHHHQQETLLTDSIQEEGSPVLLSAVEDMFVGSETGRQLDTQVTPPAHSFCIHSSCLTLALQISQHVYWECNRQTGSSSGQIVCSLSGSTLSYSSPADICPPSSFCSSS